MTEYPSKSSHKHSGFKFIDKILDNSVLTPLFLRVLACLRQKARCLPYCAVDHLCGNHLCWSSVINFENQLRYAIFCR